MTEDQDYYSVLQVNRKATAAEIDRAYARLSALYDPSQSKKRHAAERMRSVHEAYDTLSDDTQRMEYDRLLGSGLTVPGLAAGETVVTKFLSSRYGLPSVAGLVVAILIVAVLVSVFSGDDDGDATRNPNSGAASDDGPPPVAGTEVITDSGLTYIEVTPGTGAAPVLGDTGSVHYTGWLEEDGAKFDSSVDRGVPSEFVLGQVIPGWNEGLGLMKEGGTTRLIIPGDLAYGSPGRPPDIPSDATLVFDIELLAVNPTPAPTPVPSETAEATDEPTDGPDPSTTLEPTPETQSEEEAIE